MYKIYVTHVTTRRAIKISFFLMPEEKATFIPKGCLSKLQLSSWSMRKNGIFYMGKVRNLIIILKTLLADLFEPFFPMVVILEQDKTSD